jgi:hypothetical protein
MIKDKNIFMDKTNYEMKDLVTRLESRLNEKYGPVLNSDALVEVLGYPSLSSLRQAVLSRKLSLLVFTPENRRGKFALAIDVANWLVNERERALSKVDIDESEQK